MDSTLKMGVRFLAGGLIGYQLEKWARGYNPHTISGYPFLPIYGVGAAFCSKNILLDLLLVYYAEEIGGRFHPTWEYTNLASSSGFTCVSSLLTFGLLLYFAALIVK